MRPGSDDLVRGAGRRRSIGRPAGRTVGLPAPATAVRDEVVHEIVRDELPVGTTAAVDARRRSAARRDSTPVGGRGAQGAAGPVRSMLRAPGAARRAVVLREVLGSPVSLRTDGDGRAW